MVRMAQEWQGGNARRRSLESAMKETQARTKVVLRHLPPSLSNSAFQEQIAAKYVGAFTWTAFHPGKTSHKHQVHSRAYINFKKPEDVIDFYEDFNGHIFVNERGAQYKALVEYGPYQRVPKPRSKKDVREGTITKDPEYLAFVEQLGKPTEYLPSAEVQLERREAEKAAALASGAARESVIVTPLMEFVRSRRAAKSAPQRGMSGSGKSAARSGGPAASTYSLSSQKRTLEKGRAGSMMYVSDSTGVNKEMAFHSSGPHREDHQRREREILIERKRKETTEGKEKKLVREAVVAALSSTRGNPGSPRVDSNKDRTTILTKDSAETSAVEVPTLQILSTDGEPSVSRVVLAGKGSSTVVTSGEGSMASGDAREASKREFKKKQLLVARDKEESVVDVGQVFPQVTNVSSSGGATNQRHRTPASSKGLPGIVQPQQPVLAYRATSPGESASTLKQSHRRESGGRSSPRGGPSPSHSQPASLQQGTLPSTLLVDSQTQSQQPVAQLERGGKRPPRPQAIRLAGKDQAVSLFPAEVESAQCHAEEKPGKQFAGDGVSASPFDRQEARRLRNKDRPDRPVWTPRRREGTPGTDQAPTNSPLSSSSVGAVTLDVASANTQSGLDLVLKTEKGERGNHVRHNGRPGPDNRGPEPYQGPGTGSVASSGVTATGKTRYVEASGRNSRGGRGVAGVEAQDQLVVSQVEVKIDGTVTDGKTQAVKPARENGDIGVLVPTPAQQLATEDRRKQEGAFLNESGGGHRQGGRRDRNGQQGTKDGEGGLSGADLASKLVKRGRGSLALGSNEKQVWVAVQKSVTGS